jgi:hypothetical protein
MEDVEELRIVILVMRRDNQNPVRLDLKAHLPFHFFAMIVVHRD